MTQEYELEKMKLMRVCVGGSSQTNKHSLVYKRKKQKKKKKNDSFLSLWNNYRGNISILLEVYH